MDDYLKVKFIASNSEGTENNMLLLPYAKDVAYSDGVLSVSLEFFNESKETEIGLNIGLSDDLVDLIEGLLDNQDMGFGN